MDQEISGLPNWSPDGREIVNRAAGAQSSGLLIVDVETGKVRVLTTGRIISPRGRLWAIGSLLRAIATATMRFTRSGPMALASGGSARRLATMRTVPGHRMGTGLLSPFKDEAVLHPYNPQPYGDLYMMRSDGTDVRQLTSLSRRTVRASLSWSAVHLVRSYGSATSLPSRVAPSHQTAIFGE